MCAARSDLNKDAEKASEPGEMCVMMSSLDAVAAGMDDERAVLEERFALALGMISRTMRNRLDERLKHLGLTQARWLILFHLERLGDGLAQSTLAAMLGVEGPTLVRLLDRLEDQGLVERRPDEGGDRRIKRVWLTRAAKPVLRKITQAADGLRGEVLDGCDPRDIEAAIRLFEHMACRLEKS